MGTKKYFILKIFMVSLLEKCAICHSKKLVMDVVSRIVNTSKKTRTGRFCFICLFFDIRIFFYNIITILDMTSSPICFLMATSFFDSGYKLKMHIFCVAAPNFVICYLTVFPRSKFVRYCYEIDMSEHLFVTIIVQ